MIYLDHPFGSPIKPAFLKIEAALNEIEGIGDRFSENKVSCLVILNIHITDPSYWTNPLVNTGRGVLETRNYFTVSQLLSPIRHNLSVDYLVIARHPHGVYVDADESVYFLPSGMDVEDASQLLFKSARMQLTNILPDIKRAACEITQVSSFNAVSVLKVYHLIWYANAS